MNDCTPYPIALLFYFYWNKRKKVTEWLELLSL
nr:MAG TPA: hypothetical protein [Caudoviricetes sp.]